MYHKKRIYLIFTLLSFVMAGCGKVSTDATTGATPLSFAIVLEDGSHRLAVNDVRKENDVLIFVSEIKITVRGYITGILESGMSAIADFSNANGPLYRTPSILLGWVDTLNVRADECQFSFMMEMPAENHKELMEAQNLGVVDLKLELSSTMNVWNDTMSYQLSYPVDNGPAAILCKDFLTGKTTLQLSDEMLDLQKSKINVGYMTFKDRDFVLIVSEKQTEGLVPEPVEQISWGAKIPDIPDSGVIHVWMCDPDSFKRRYVLFMPVSGSNKESD